MSFTERLKQPYVLALVFLFIYLSPNILFPGHARYLIHDNLNSNVVWYKVLFDSGTLFASSNAIIPNMCWGIPRGVMESDLNINVLFYCIFSPLTAYNINIVVIHTIAFAGMYLLLNQYIFKRSYSAHSAWLALTFAILPFWPAGGLSVAGQPFAIWAMLNILNRNLSLKNWIIIALLPFYSSIIFSNLFFACGLFVLIISYSIVKRKLNYYGLLAWLVFFVFMLIPEYRLFYMQFVKHLTSARSNYFEFLLNIKGVLSLSLKLMLKGQYHFYSMQWPIIIFTVLLAVLITKGFANRLLLVSLLLGIFLCSFADILHKSKDFAPLLNALGEIKYMQFRFICMLPVLWHLAFALAIYLILLNYPKLKKTVLVGIAINAGLTLFCVFPTDSSDSSFVENAFYYTYIHNTDGYHSTFNRYYSPALFTDIKNKINYHNQYALCFGFHAEVAQYNDIYTVSSTYSYLPNNKAFSVKSIFLPATRDTDYKVHYHYDSLPAAKIVAIEKDTANWHKQPIAYILSVYRIDNYQSIGLDSVAHIISHDGGDIDGIFVYKFHVL